MERILLVEDNEHIMRINATYLSGLGYWIEQAYAVQKAREILKEYAIDLIVLDVMLPDGDGVDFCEAIRTRTGTPILFLTAKASGADIVSGLRRGGDDYLTKPYELNELAARIEALLRRSHNTFADGHSLTVGPLCFDVVRAQVTVNGEDLLLSGKEFGLLLVLARNRNKPVPREELLRSVWGFTQTDASSFLWTTISRLKKKIAPYENLFYIDSSQEGYELVTIGGSL